MVGEAAVVHFTDSEKEQALEVYLRHGANAASDQFDVPVGTLVRWVREAGLVGARVQLTREAQEIRRLTLADDLITDAHQLREQLFAPAKVIQWDEGELREETIDQPTFADKERIVKSIGNLADSAIKLAGGQIASATVVPVQVNIVREGGGT
jgi:transposase-like protein